MAELKAKTSLDSKGFVKGTSKLNKSVDSFQKRLSPIGAKIGAAFTVGAITAFTKKVIDTGSALTDMSTQLSIGVEELLMIVTGKQPTC